MKQFTSSTDLIPFEINGTVFEAAGTLPADSFVEFLLAVGELGRVGQDRGDDAGFDADVLRNQKDLMAEAVRIALTPESADAFIAALSDKQRPVSLALLQEALMWLLEQYNLAGGDDDDTEEAAVGERPTKRTRGSATGSRTTEDGSEGD